MFSFFKKKEIDPDTEALECFKTDFSIFGQRRFPQREEGTYTCKQKHHALRFELWKKNHFAWIPSELYQYRDFCLESTFSFSHENGHSSCGVIFRFINNENFYYFLVSNHGLFRFDVLFNGNPLKIIEWTPSAHIEPGHCTIRVIAHGSNYSFFINDEWVAEIDDDKLFNGKIGIAAQNFNDAEKAEFQFHSLTLESRPVPVERAYWRWVHYIPVEISARITFARTLTNMGNFTAAVVELKKALKHDEHNEEALLLYALATVRLKVYNKALSTLDKILLQNPSQREAIFEKANTLYLTNDYLAARDFLRGQIDRFKDASTLWNLLGNCEYSLGNWEKAAAAYREATVLEPMMPLFSINLARMLEKFGHTTEALAAYIKAAHTLFREEAYDELSLILPKITSLDPDNDEVLAFEAKMLFHENKKNEAKPILEKLVRSDVKDSAVYFLLALIAIEEGRREEALPNLEKAVALEPDFALYRWRLAESRRSLKQDFLPDLTKARALAPDDPWVNNLSGLYHFDRGELEPALHFLEKAHTAAPYEIEITINLAETLFRLERKDEARSLIDAELALHDDARLHNLRGNLAAREADYQRAAQEYEKALQKDPDNALYLENCAASCIEADMITRAEELLVKLIDKKPSPSAYNLLGNLCVIRTEYLRADLCYEEGLLLDPDSRELRKNRTSLALERSQYALAKELITAVLKKEPANKEFLALQENLRKKFELSIQCAQCRREWWVYRDIPEQEMGKIYGEPPAKSPAGKCPQCGNVYCIACAQSHLKQKRFVCAQCGENLKLSDNHLRYLVSQYLTEQNKTE